MKVIKTTIMASLSVFGICFGSDFDKNAVKICEDQISNGLKTNQIRIDWSNATDPLLKQQKFSLLISEIAGTIINRQWTYAGGTVWPLLDWSKVGTLKALLDDQAKILEETHIVAQSDEEMAKLTTVSWTVGTMGKDAEPWFEDWFLSLAQGTNANLKRLVFLTIANFGEDMLKETNTLRTIDWNKWEIAFNQSDNLGKALILTCMTDLANRSENYTKASEIHLAVFNGTSEELKAIALYAGSKKLGMDVTNKWLDIASNSTNLKLKALAQDALAK